MINFCSYFYRWLVSQVATFETLSMVPCGVEPKNAGTGTRTLATTIIVTPRIFTFNDASVLCRKGPIAERKLTSCQSVSLIGGMRRSRTQLLETNGEGRGDSFEWKWLVLGDSKWWPFYEPIQVGNMQMWRRNDCQLKFYAPHYGEGDLRQPASRVVDPFAVSRGIAS